MRRWKVVLIAVLVAWGIAAVVAVTCWEPSEAQGVYTLPTMRADTQPSPDWLYPDPNSLALLSLEAAEKWSPEALEYELLPLSGYGELAK